MKFLDNLCSEDDEIVDKTVDNEYWYLPRISCLYPKLNTPKWRALSMIQFILYLSCSLYHVILFAITATKLIDDKMEMYQSLNYLGMLSINTYVLIFLQIYRKTYSKIHRAIGTGLFNYDEETEEFRKTSIFNIQRKKKIALKLMLLYFSSLPIIMFFLEQFLNAYSGGDNEMLLSPNLPINIWIPYDTNNLIGCSSASFLIALTCNIAVVIFTNADLSLFTICEYLAMELRLLIHSLNRLPERTLHLYRLHREDTNISIETLKSNKNLSNCYRDCLKQNVIHHQNIIKLFYLCRKQTALILWLTFAMCAIVIASSGVSVIKSEGKIGSRLVSVLFCLAEILVCFFFSYCCSQITAASEDLALTLYSTKWMSMNKNEVQMIRIMMIRSQIPLVISYKNITNFDYITFSSMMNTAYSYFNLLLAFS